MEARFQFVPLRLTLDRRARLFRTLRQDLPNLELLVVAARRSVRLNLSIATGQSDPVGGWVSDKEDLPAPQARIRVSGAPLRLITVVYPFAEGVNSGVKVRSLDGLPDGVGGVRLRRGRARDDTILYSWDGSPLPLDGAMLASPIAICTEHEKLRLQDGQWAVIG
jgi:hypothetical protein